MKKIAFYISEFRDGGTEVVYMNLINEIKLRGISADFIVGKMFNTSMLARLNESEINVINLGTRHSFLCLIKLLFYFLKNDVAVVVSDKDRTARSLCLLKKIFGMKFKIFMNAHINYYEYFKNSKSNKKKNFKKILDEIDGVIAVSNGVAQNLENLFPSSKYKITTIYNGIIKNKFQETSFGINDVLFDNNITTVLSVGRLEKEKSYETLIQAFSILSKKINCRLIILGEGSERNKLQKLIDELSLSDKVELKGFVNYPREYMLRSSIFVLSSISEGLSNVIIEALGAGLPVVSTDCNYGPAEVLENGRYGKLVPVKNSEMLAAAIEETLINPPDREFLIKRSLDFSVEKSAEQYLNLISDHIDKKN